MNKNQNDEYQLYLGSHVSFSAPKYFVGSVQESLEYGNNCLMLYTGAPQNTARKPLDKLNIEQAHRLLKENNIGLDKIVVHAPYIINLCSEKSETRELAIDFLEQEINRCMQIGASLLVLHPGSRLSQSLDVGLQQVIDGLNFVLNKVDTNVIICIETMAGKGSEVGINIDEIKHIISNIHKKENIGVCVDTCHINDAGYEVSRFDEYLDEFDEKIGLEKIKVIHLNDSKNPLGAHKDRHENIGYGYVGFENLLNVAWNKRLNGIIKILETPYYLSEQNNKKNPLPPYKYEIEIIRNKKWFDFRK